MFAHMVIRTLLQTTGYDESSPEPHPPAPRALWRSPRGHKSSARPTPTRASKSRRLNLDEEHSLQESLAPSPPALTVPPTPQSGRPVARPAVVNTDDTDTVAIGDAAAPSTLRRRMHREEDEGDEQDADDQGIVEWSDYDRDNNYADEDDDDDDHDVEADDVDKLDQSGGSANE